MTKLNLNLAFLVATGIALAGCIEENVQVLTPTVGNSSDIMSFQRARVGQAENGIRTLGDELVGSQGLST